MVRVDKCAPMSAPKTTDKPPLPSRFGSTLKMSANIKVVVRVRPLNDKEKDLNNPVVVDVVDDRMLVFDPKEEVRPFFYQGIQQSNKCHLKRANKELKFVFDNVCDMNATNEHVFETTTKDILSSLMEGYNCSVFVYGATGAGKTFTMIGTIDNPGITYLTMEHLFCLMGSLEKEREFDIAVSYLEVYNENVYDLLKPSNTPLQLREDSKYGVMVAGLTLHSIKTACELLNMLDEGNKNRTQHPTDANAESSRSHAVFQVYLNMRYKTSGQMRMVKLSMIDLAGSERASATGCVGDRFKEGANINKSLLSLGNCINKLADGSAYISYRDSKLTRLLKDSLGGNCKTVMIANISPSSTSYEDTYNTLKYAARASKIQLTIKKNIVDANMRSSQYVKINEELKKMIKELEAKLSIAEMRPVNQAAKEAEKEVSKEKEKAKQEWRRRILEAEEALCAAEKTLVPLMSRARVLALRRQFRTRAAGDFAELAHRSSSETMEQRCTEDIPRDERSAEHYRKLSADVDARVLPAWAEWEQRKTRLHVLLDRALSDCPDLTEFVQVIQLKSELRRVRASDELRLKLLSIEYAQMSRISGYLTDMPNLLKKLYLTLKGYDKAPPSLTEEYLQVMKKSKGKGITWSDKDNDSDAVFKIISNLDWDKPTMMTDFNFNKDLNSTVDIDSEDLTDTENRPLITSTKKRKGSPMANFSFNNDLNSTVDLESKDLTDTENHPIITSTKKRKGTPIKMINNDTIVINDSFELLDTTKTMSAKKIKRESDELEAIDPKNLNSTFMMAGKMDPLKQRVKFEKENVLVRKPLTDGTNTMHQEQRAVHFADRGKVVKPLVKTLSYRRPAGGAGAARYAGGTGAMRPVSGTGAVRGVGGARAGPLSGFGSSLPRDGTRFNRNLVQAY